MNLNKTILIAGDDIGSMEALKQGCRALGARVLTAMDGENALRLMQKTSPDLVVLDIEMPADKGKKVYEKLLNDPRYTPLPVILVSGKSDPEAIRHCESLGAHYVLKDAGTWNNLKPLICKILRPDHGPAKISAARARACASSKILVVEDDLQLSKSLTIRLQAYGVEVLTASSGMQGFWKAMKSSPELIITDYIMPNGDGESLLIRLNNNALLKQIPVIVITGWAGDVENCRDLKSEMLEHRGAAAFFTKPLDFDALIETLGAHVALRPPNTGHREKAQDTKVSRGA